MNAAVNADTTLVGLMGWPVRQSAVTQCTTLHLPLGAELGHTPLPVAAAPSTVWARPVLGLRGLGFRANVTVPHKQVVMPFLDSVSEAARTIGAVNTVVEDDGRPAGDNTDARGFAANRRRTASRLPAAPRPCWRGRFGARSALCTAAERGGAGKYFNCNPARATELVAEFASQSQSSTLIVLPFLKASGRLQRLTS